MKQSRILVALTGLLAISCAEGKTVLFNADQQDGGTAGTSGSVQSNNGQSGMGENSKGQAGSQSAGQAGSDSSGMAGVGGDAGTAGSMTLPEGGAAGTSSAGQAGSLPVAGSSGDAGSSGTAGAGTAGQVTNFPCGIDCSTISVPNCFKSICDENQAKCIVVEDNGTPCNDGLFCTTGDVCKGGMCVGETPNTCGMSGNECQKVVCNESFKTCTLSADNNNLPCTPTNLCESNGKCQLGVCKGAPKDCTGAAVPDACHVGSCNPSTGACDPVPGNDGGACSNIGDPCTVNKTCNSGVCQGGTPKDCSGYSGQCAVGTCDAMSGACYSKAILPGEPCAAKTDQCNQGLCDTNGQCKANPINEGMSCNDKSSCTTGETCQTGTCSGGSVIPNCCQIAFITEGTVSSTPTVLSVLQEGGRSATAYTNNGDMGTYTSDTSFLNQYSRIVLHKRNRELTSAEATALQTWVNEGGRLIVTGHDSVGSPTDNLMAGIVNCLNPSDFLSSDDLVVTNASHPIMMGPAQAFTLNQSLLAATSDHDTCAPGTGAIQLVRADGFSSSTSKVQITENIGVGQGMVIYWNGNDNVDDASTLEEWEGIEGTQPALQNLFRNSLDYICKP
jgi:hypothetical protein